MELEQWRKFGEIQYIRGRLDELFKIDSFVDLDMSNGRKLDARISKYMEKLEKLDPLAFELWRVERENMQHTLNRQRKNEED